MSGCERKGWLFRGCKFEPRYDLSPADMSRLGKVSNAQPEHLDKFRTKTYVHDVCVRCGKVIPRDERENQRLRDRLAE